MTYHQMAHVLRSAAAISGSREFFLVGSQAILMCVPNVPAELLKSVKMDVWIDAPDEIAELIEGTLGKDSQFHHTFGYHVDMVGPLTAVLPRNWRSRAIEVRDVPHFGNSDVTSPSVADLAASKLVAGREKDFEWVSALVESGGVSGPEMDAVIEEIEDETAQNRAMRGKRVVCGGGIGVPGW